MSTAHATTTRVIRRFGRLIIPGLAGLAAGALVASSAALAAGVDSVNFGTPTSAGSCTNVPVNLSKSSSDPARTISVTIQLDANLVLCAATPLLSIPRGSWLDAFGSGTPFYFVADQGGGKYKIDQSVFGSPCGPTSGGTLFTISVKPANGTVTSGTMTFVGPVTLISCGNTALPAVSGGGSTINFPGPSPVDPLVSFTATQVVSGNGTGGTTQTRFDFVLPANATGIEIYKSPFGNNPEYDDPAPGGTLRKINFQTLTATVPTGYDADRGQPFDAILGWGWRTDVLTTNRALSPGDPHDTFAYAFNADPASVWEIDTNRLGPGPYQVRVVCGDPVTTQRACVAVEGVAFLTNVLTNGGGIYTEATHPVTVADGFLTVWIGGTTPNTPAASHTKINLIEVRASGGGPSGSPAPPVTTFPPPARYDLLGTTGVSPLIYQGSERDYFYYVAYATNGADRSVPTALASGVLTYHLGDFAKPGVECDGDNSIDAFDLAFFSQNYGLTIPDGDSRACLDIAPVGTADPTIGLPLTDSVIDAQDLNIFTTNFGAVSKAIAIPALAAVDRIAVEPVEVEAGVRADLHMQGAGDVRTVSVRLEWDPQVVEPIGVAAGELLDAQVGIALQPSPGGVDFSLLGARDVGLGGDGIAASVRFLRLAAGDPRVRIASARGFDLAGRMLEIATDLDPTDALATPQVTALLGNVPNPFNPTTKITFSLANRQMVGLAVYSLSGRLVRNLVHESRAAGRHAVTWDGTDNQGNRVSSGVYYARLVTVEGGSSRPLVLVK